MINSKLFTKTYRAAVRNQSTLSANCQAMAEMVVAEHDPSKPAKAEYDRLRELAVGALKAGNVPKPDRNILGRVYQYLTVMMFPTEVVEVAKGKDKNGPVTKKAEDCTGTTRELETAAKQVREAVGISDGRAGNKQPAKPNGAIDEAALAALVKADVAAGVAALTRVLARYGYGVEKIRKTAKPRPSPRAAKTAHVPAPAATGESISA